LLVEHHMGLVMGVADRVHVLDFGRPDRERRPARGAGRPEGRRGLPGDDPLPEPLLQLEDVTARYGPVTPLHGVSLTVGEGEAVAVLGANGAGKTTTLRAISGAVRRSGRIAFRRAEHRRSSPEATAAPGSRTSPRAAAR
jgi:ABC-type branched-subunit amino acid transport system ATPase component